MIAALWIAVVVLFLCGGILVMAAMSLALRVAQLEVKLEQLRSDLTGDGR
jgi:hypothetical protein